MKKLLQKINRNNQFRIHKQISQDLLLMIQNKMKIQQIQLDLPALIYLELIKLMLPNLNQQNHLKLLLRHHQDYLQVQAFHHLQHQMTKSLKLKSNPLKHQVCQAYLQDLDLEDKLQSLKKKRVRINQWIYLAN